MKLYDFLYKYETEDKGRKCVIHGDMVMSNILMNKPEKIKFVDMRGKLGNKTTIYGDWLYDWAKLYQSLIGYDEILQNKQVSKEYKKQMLQYFEKYFVSLYSLKDLQNMKIITNSLLFTLIPLHDNVKCIHYFELIDTSILNEIT